MHTILKDIFRVINLLGAKTRRVFAFYYCGKIYDIKIILGVIKIYLIQNILLHSYISLTDSIKKRLINYVFRCNKPTNIKNQEVKIVIFINYSCMIHKEESHLNDTKIPGFRILHKRPR